jgi:hypothetical protein
VHLSLEETAILFNNQAVTDQNCIHPRRQFTRRRASEAAGSDCLKIFGRKEIDNRLIHRIMKQSLQKSGTMPAIRRKFECGWQYFYSSGGHQ